jgi:hypothetical protein
MKKIVKTIFKIVIGMIVVLALVLGIIVYRYWESVDILRGTQNLAAAPQDIPEAVEPAIAVQDRGEADWPRWRGSDGSARSTVTPILKDWSSGLERL